MPVLLTFFFFFQILPVQVFFSPYDHSRNLSMHISISKKSGKDENIYDVFIVSLQTKTEPPIKKC